MRGAARLLLGLALAGASTSGQAQVMWQNVERGMSPDEVRGIQPLAQTVPKPETLYDGSKCSLHIPIYEIGHDAFEVCFFFKDAALTQVTLGMAGRPDKNDFDNVVQLLTARYGSPLGISQSTIGWDADWMLPSGVNIAVTFIEEPLIPLINVNYQYRLKSESSKL